MFIVTPEKTDQLSYIAAEFYQAGTNTPAFDQFPDAKFITVMGENHTVLSTWNKMFGSFLPQMTKGDLDIFNDYYHDGWGHMYIACQLAFGAAETIEQALKNLMYSIEKARGYNRILIPSSMLSEMEHHLPIHWGHWFKCQKCRFNGDRDYIAALNIARRGLAKLAKTKEPKPVPYSGSGVALPFPPIQFFANRIFTALRGFNKSAVLMPVYPLIC